MILLLVNKILITLFVLSCLNILRQGFFFTKALINMGKENFKPFLMTNLGKWLLGLSIAFVLTGIFAGITL